MSLRRQDVSGAETDLWRREDVSRPSRRSHSAATKFVEE